MYRFTIALYTVVERRLIIVRVIVSLWSSAVRLFSRYAHSPHSLHTSLAARTHISTSRLSRHKQPPFTEFLPPPARKVTDRSRPFRATERCPSLKRRQRTLTMWVANTQSANSRSLSVYQGVPVYLIFEKAFVDQFLKKREKQKRTTTNCIKSLKSVKIWPQSWILSRSLWNNKINLFFF